MTQCDLFDVLEKATSNAVTISESGPLTERSPAPADGPTRARVRVSGTFRISKKPEGDVVSSYLLEEARQKQLAAQGIFKMAASLREIGCPAEFIRRLDHAFEDKRRHAQILAEAAHASDQLVGDPRDQGELFDLWSLALETATARCVVDTYAAARFAYQAQMAEVPELRALFLDIGRDDAVAATLFWELLAWELSHLSPARGRSIATEQRQVHEALRLAVEAPLPEDLHLVAGVPDADAGHALLDVLEQRLWSDDAAA